MTKEEFISQIKKDGKYGFNDYYVEGALGELPGCQAIKESEQITENGWETKYYGVKTPYKGKIDSNIIGIVSVTKRAFREIIRLLPLRFNKITEAMKLIYVCEGGLKEVELKSKEFCPFCREIVRVGWRIAEDIDLFYCLAMFLQFSPTYRVWLQDILGELNKDNFEKHPLSEFLRLKRIFMARLCVQQDKTEFLLWVGMIALALNKKSAKRFIKELDLEKCKIDTMDWYFCLRRNSYNFRGELLEERLKEVEIIDKEQGNVFLGI